MPLWLFGISLSFFGGERNPNHPARLLTKRVFHHRKICFVLFNARGISFLYPSETTHGAVNHIQETVKKNNNNLSFPADFSTGLSLCLCVPRPSNFSHTSDASNPPTPPHHNSWRLSEGPWRYTATPAFQRGSSLVVSGAPNGPSQKKVNATKSTQNTSTSRQGGVKTLSIRHVNIITEKW